MSVTRSARGEHREMSCPVFMLYAIDGKAVVYTVRYTNRTRAQEDLLQAWSSPKALGGPGSIVF